MGIFDAKRFGLIVVIIVALAVTFWRIRKRSLSDHDDKTMP